MKHKFKRLIPVLVLLLLLTACAEEPAVEADPQQEEEIIISVDPADGGSFTMSVTRFNTINPLFNSERSLRQVHNLIYEGLVDYDRNMEPAPALASSWTQAADGQSIDFVLRDNVYWHDGEPFKAEDVLFTFRLIKGNIRQIQNASIYRMSLQHISDMRVVEGNILRVTFTRPFSNALEVMGFPILPSHLFEGNNVTALLEQDFPVVGTGPYRVTDHQPMKSLVLEKNDRYWSKVPYIDQIDVQIVPDRQAQISLFENGDLDLAQPLSIDWGRFTNDKNVSIYEFVSNQYEFIGFNFKNPLLKEQTLREAVAYAIDRHSLVNNIFLGHGTVTDVPIHPESWLYSEESIQYGYDAGRANSLLNAAYSWDESGKYRTNEAGEPLVFTLITNDDNLLREKTAYYLQEQLQEVGIQLEVSLLEWEAFNQAVNSGSYDLVLAGWELSAIPDLSFAFHSSQIGKTNFISYSDETMDQLLVNAFNAPNRESKQEAYQELQAYISDQLPYVSLLFQNSGVMVKNQIKGISGTGIQNFFYDVEHWYIQTK